VRCVPVSGADAQRLVAILHDAEEDDDRLRGALGDPACQAYAAVSGDAAVGAAVVRWARGQSLVPSEILYIAVVDAQRRSGIGRKIIEAIVAELPAHGRRLLVGTANSSLDNIAFYQKCGFRMHSVRRDYFTYIQPPIQEGGIVMRDMVVFDFDLDAG
jgi:ribosomal protein S18 acetylase RimI-like enzyme